jgi:hypothetical protein
MPAIAFPVGTSPGTKPNESQGRLVNVFFDEVETVTDGQERPRWRAAPGLVRRTNITDYTHCRGMYPAGNVLLVVLDGRIYAVSTAWAATNLGALTGTGFVSIARNRKAPVADIVAVTDSQAYNLFTASAPTTFADSDLPSPISVDYVSGYFAFLTSTGLIYCTGLNDVTVDALSFTRAQRREGGAVRGVTFRDEFYAFKVDSCEVYRDVGTSPFPLGFVTLIPVGLISIGAIAGAISGAQSGWADALLWAANDFTVRMLAPGGGYAPQVVSKPWVSRRLEALSPAQRQALTAFVTMSGGHQFWHLATDAWTIVYDVTTGQWHERTAADGLRWRAEQSARFNDEWVVGDFELGAVYSVSETARRDHDTVIRGLIESHAMVPFPGAGNCPRADFLFTAGVGQVDGEDPVQTDPRVWISWSNDAGGRWSNPLLRSIGAAGQYGKLVTVNRTGDFGPQGRKWRVEFSDPVHLVFHGGSMAAEQLTE